MSKIEVAIDGLCQPSNPNGIACYAFLIKNEEDGQLLQSEFGLAAEPFSANATNNVAEYTALIKGLEWLIRNGHKSSKVVVKSDSKLLVNQLNGEYRIRNSRIIPLFKKAAEMRKEFHSLMIKWVPREENKEADVLTNKAYNAAILEHPELLDRITAGGRQTADRR